VYKFSLFLVKILTYFLRSDYLYDELTCWMYKDFILSNVHVQVRWNRD
jgi:hypothetical protein